jgi:hypothetical protein
MCVCVWGGGGGGGGGGAGGGGAAPPPPSTRAAAAPRARMQAFFKNGCQSVTNLRPPCVANCPIAVMLGESNSKVELSAFMLATLDQNAVHEWKWST